MKGWEDDRAPGFVLGQDIDRASPKNKIRTSPRGSPSNQLSPLPAGRRSRGARRLRSAQTKVLRAVKVQRAMRSIGAKRKKARNLWARGATKLASVLGFKWLGSEHVQRRKRSIFGNVRGGTPIDDLSLPRISLHNGSEGKTLFDAGQGSSGGLVDAESNAAAASSTVTSLKIQQRRTTTKAREKLDGTGRDNIHQNVRPSSPSAVAVPSASHEPQEQEPLVHGRLTATPETVRKQLLKKKMKGAITKVKKFVRVVRLSYADTFTGSKRVSLTELLGRLRAHYDPDGVHSNANDSQHHFYTDLALLQRESLKHDPRVRRILDFIWEATDRDGSGTIDKEEYMVMCTKVYRAVVDDTDSPEAHAEIQRIAEEDWETDRQGHDHLDYNRFTRAWFQLADHWTHDLSPESYEKFLTNIFVSLTERDANGHIVWRNDKDIHHYDPDADDSEKESQLSAAFVEKNVIVKKKKKKKRSSSGMSQEALEKYLARMNSSKKNVDSRKAHVAIVQEGTFDRNVRLAKINSRNGLYIGSVVPPPEGWDEELTHKMINQSAFMRISLKGGRGIYSRNTDDSDAQDDKWLSADGTSYLDAYPRELGDSLKRLAVTTQVRGEAGKKNAARLLSRLWEENNPWNTGMLGSSPGGPGGWLVHFTREGEDKLDPRLQAGAGGGYGSERDYSGKEDGFGFGFNGEDGGKIANKLRDGMSKTQSFDDMYKDHRGNHADGKNDTKVAQDPLAEYRPFLSATGESQGQKNRPVSAPAHRRSRRSSRVGLPASPAPTPMGRPGTASPSLNRRARRRNKKRRKRAKREFVSGAGVVLLARPNSAHDLQSTTVKSSSIKKNSAGRRRKRLTGSKSTGSIRRRPKSASHARTRMNRRKEQNAEPSQSALQTSAEMPMAESSRSKRRPKSASTTRRRMNKFIEGTHIFDSLSQPHKRYNRPVSAESSSVKKNGNGKEKSKRPRQKITLMRLKPSCTTNDICDVFGALGLPVALSDVRLYKLKKNFRKASVFFHRYTDYKKAVQILGIVNEAMISGPLTQGPFDALAGEIDKRVEVSEKPNILSDTRLPQGVANDIRPMSSIEEIQKVVAVNAIRIPKTLRPLSASSRYGKGANHRHGSKN